MMTGMPSFGEAQMNKKVTYKELEQKVVQLEKKVAAFEHQDVSLKESKKRYRTLLDFAPYPVATFSLNGRITYLNPAFTEVFGWTLDDMKNRKAAFVPQELAPQTSQMLKELFKQRRVTRYVTKRLAKDGRMLDVIARGAVFTKAEMGVQGELVIFRDITTEKQVARNNEAMLRISMALPQYPDLEALLDYISREIKLLLNTQGALVILLDEEKDEFFFPGAAYDDDATKQKVKEIRLPVDSMVSGKVVKTGQAILDNDAAKDSALYHQRDREFGYSFDNYVIVPVSSSDRIIGVLAAFNKREGLFETPDMEVLEMIAGTVGLSIENARFSEDLKKSHRELASLDRAKSKAINHLSHELKTPMAIFSGTLNILEKKLNQLPQKTWQRSIKRAYRNIERVKHLQDEINDIIQEKGLETQKTMSFLVDQCRDLLEGTIEQESSDISILDSISKRIDTIFQVKNNTPENIDLQKLVRERLAAISMEFDRRNLTIVQESEPVPLILMPLDPVRKVVDGLLKNAIENTPDHGKILVRVSPQNSGVILVVKDYGVGILKSHQNKIFQGFFTTQQTADYSTKSSFDFNAGGRGADLLRMTIFSERYGFNIRVKSDRCLFIPGKDDACPGDIDDCTFCKEHDDCYKSGGSQFEVEF